MSLLLLHFLITLSYLQNLCHLIDSIKPIDTLLACT